MVEITKEVTSPKKKRNEDTGEEEAAEGKTEGKEGELGGCAIAEEGKA